MSPTLLQELKTKGAQKEEVSCRGKAHTSSKRVWEHGITISATPKEARR
jgi:hypothetical protein